LLRLLQLPWSVFTSSTTEVNQVNVVVPYTPPEELVPVDEEEIRNIFSPDGILEKKFPRI